MTREPVRVCICGKDDVLVRSLAVKLVGVFGFYLRDLTKSSPEGITQALKLAEREQHILFALRSTIGSLPENSFNILLLEGGGKRTRMQHEFDLAVYLSSLPGDEKVFHIRDTLLRRFPQLRLTS